MATAAPMKNMIVTCATGSDVDSDPLESDVSAFILQAIGGNVSWEDPDGIQFTLIAGVPLFVEAISFRGHVLTFNGATGTTVEIMQILGIPM
jgi:hypothetical protein